MDAFPIKYGIIISEFRSPDAMQTGNKTFGLMVFPFFTAAIHIERKTRSHTDNFGENNVKCLIAKGICRFVPHSSAGGF